jgi:hypothetical protein
MSLPLIALIALPGTAYAYLDPGTGSYLVQLLVAGILGALYLVKIYWNKIRDTFKRILTSSPKPPKKD